MIVAILIIFFILAWASNRDYFNEPDEDEDNIKPDSDLKMMMGLLLLPWVILIVTEVNISSYPATEVAGSFFFRRAEKLNSGGFVQKYSDQGGFVQKYWTMIAARYCYVLSSHAPRLFRFDQTKSNCSAVPKT